MDDILVSVCCCTYNHEPYIRDCLEGFVKQKTDFPVEYIIHDDASTDKTRIIIQEYAESYPDRIKPILQTENQYSQGVDPCTHIVLPSARGKYIALCEGDDYWTDTLKLQKQIDYLEKHEEVGLCYTDYCIRNASLELVQEACFRNGKYRPTSFVEHLLSQGYIAPMTWVFRKELYSRLEIPSSFIDGSFAIALEFFQKSVVGYLDEVTAVHVVHAGSATNLVNPAENFRYQYDVFQEQLYYAREYVGDSLATKICFEKYLELLPMAITVHNNDFLQEASSFFTSKGADFLDIYKHSELINSLKEDAFLARNSHAYRLGSAIIRPFKKLFRK